MDAGSRAAGCSYPLAIRSGRSRVPLLPWGGTRGAGAGFRYPFRFPPQRTKPPAEAGGCSLVRSVEPTRQTSELSSAPVPELPASSSRVPASGFETLNCRGLLREREGREDPMY